MMPRRAHVQRFITDVVRPAFEDVADELRKQGYEVQVKDAEDDGGVALEVSHGEHLDFSYAVKPEAFVRPSLTPDEAADEEERKYFRAEVHLREGGRTMTSWAGAATRSLATSSTSTSGTVTICTWCAERPRRVQDAGGSARNRRRFHMGRSPVTSFRVASARAARRPAYGWRLPVRSAHGRRIPSGTRPCAAPRRAGP